MRMLFLFLGTALIIAAIVVTLGAFNDRTVYTILVPGIVVGLIVVVIGLRSGRP